MTKYANSKAITANSPYIKTASLIPNFCKTKIYTTFNKIVHGYPIMNRRVLGWN